MIAKIYSAIPSGYSGQIVSVEGDSSQGLPAFNIVGMANKTITEARDRVRSALANSHFTFPDRKVTINLAPAGVSKDGVHLDLPIALAILVLSQQLLSSDVADTLFVGELSLDGSLRPVKGIINVVETAKQAGFSRICLPIANLPQAHLISGIEIIGIKSLSQLFQILKHQIPAPTANFSTKIVVKNTKTEENTLNFSHIHGQAAAKRAFTIALAGRHNILLSGPPGAGKTMLARAALNLLPDLSPSEQISATKLHSLAGTTTDVITKRPFYAPHHTASTTSIIGGGARVTPGAISLAHTGVLFFDELPEYRRDVLEALRQPLEDRQITISRAQAHATYPADFLFIATMNPCPCGYAGDPTHPCTCTPVQLHNYQKKLSGPLFDRLDLTVNVQRVPNQDLLTPTTQSDQNTNVVKNTITEAISRQAARYGSSTLKNGTLSSPQVSEYIHLTPDATKLLSSASDNLQLSARSYFKTLKVARTIADLAASDQVTAEHIAEALSFRQRLASP